MPKLPTIPYPSEHSEKNHGRDPVDRLPFRVHSSMRIEEVGIRCGMGNLKDDDPSCSLGDDSKSKGGRRFMYKESV